MRTITVNDIEYKWKVGSQHVLIQGPNKLKLVPTKVEATVGKHTPQDFDDRIATITPAMIAEYIKRNVSN